ncbi:MAG TPA: hypothetical protein VNL92_02095 [Dehalococcoidia bacterium]|nr:hypothetical protein [Dehalococcoidia bacterium]
MNFIDFGLSEAQLQALVESEAEAALGPDWRTAPAHDATAAALLAILIKVVCENNRRLTEQFESLGLRLRS